MLEARGKRWTFWWPPGGPLARSVPLGQSVQQYPWLVLHVRGKTVSILVAARSLARSFLSYWSVGTAVPMVGAEF